MISAGMQIFEPNLQAAARWAGAGGEAGTAGRQDEPPAATHPTIQTIAQLPANTSAPETLITEQGLQALGLQPFPRAGCSRPPIR